MGSNKGSVGSSSSSKTTCSGTSSSRGDSGTSGTHTTTTSGSSRITATIDPSHITDGTANAAGCLWRIEYDGAQISESDKLKRDILLYWLWQEGMYTN